MLVKYNPKFLIHYINRIQPDPKLLKQFKKRTDLFTQNQQSKHLKDHELVGKLSSLRAFSITKDIRIIYKQISPTRVIFLDIGTHPQIYSTQETNT